MANENVVVNIAATSDFSNLIADVNRVSASLAKLQRDLVVSDKALVKNVQKLNNDFANTLAASGQFSKHFVTLTSGAEKFGQSLETGRLKLRDYFSTLKTHVTEQRSLITDLAKQQVQLQNAIVQPLGKNAQGLMQYNVMVARGLDEVANKTKIAQMQASIMNKVIQQGANQLINWGKNTQWAGRQLTVGLTIPITAFGKAAADAFKLADKELVRLTKVYGDLGGATSAELGKIRKEVGETARALAQDLGASYRETLGLAADIAATGKTGEDLLGSVRETTRLAVLGEVDRQEAMKATLAIQSAFKSNTEELTESINFLNAVENQTSTTLNDLVTAIPKAGPVIKGLGGDVQDLALYITAMREGGISASEGANALKSALASLINPTDVAVNKFKSFGIDLLGIVKSNAGDTTQTLLALQSALDRLDPLQKQQAIEQLFGKFQFARLNALFENLGKEGSQTLKVLDLMKASTSELGALADRELAMVTESASGRYARAIEKLKADLAGVGESFLGIATTFINVVDKFVNFMNNLPDPVKKILGLAAGITAVAGPIIMLTGVLGNFFGYIIKGISHFRAFFKGAEGWKLLTPEILAANQAGDLAEDTFYKDAKAADVLRVAIENLITEYAQLTQMVNSGVVPMSTAAGNPLSLVARQVDPNNPLSGRYQTRDIAHMNPRALMSAEQRAAQTMFGMVPSAPAVNLLVGQNPMIYSQGDLPKIEGLTSYTRKTTIGGIPTSRQVSAGMLSPEIAKWHSMMATLSTMSKTEIEELRQSIALTGQSTALFMERFDDILPAVSKVTDNASTMSYSIVSELQSGKITLEQARSKIISLNFQIEKMIAESAAAAAASRGLTINPYVVPLTNQPIVDPSGKPNTRQMFRGPNQQFLEDLGRAAGVRTSGAGYNVETTVPVAVPPGYMRGPSGLIVPIIKRNNGGPIYMTNGETVPGPNINADVVPAMLTPGEFVLTRGTVAREGSDAVEALHRGEATIVPFNANKGGQVPGYNTGSFVKLLRNLSSSRARKLSPGFGGSQKYYQAKGTAGVYIGDITDPKILSKYPEFVRNGKISRQSINSLVKNGKIPGDLFAAAIKASGAKMLGSADNFLIGLLNNGIITKSQFNKISKQIEKDYFSYLSKASEVGDLNNKYWSIANKVITKELGGRSSNAGHLWHGYSSSVGQFTGSNTLKSGTSGPSTTPRLIKVSDKNGNIIDFGKLEGNKNYLFAHTKTPDPLIQRAKKLNTGGMVHGYNRGGMVGGYNRGGRIPGVQNKRFGGFVASSLLSMLGYSLGSSAGQNVGGQTGSMIGGSIGSILPFMLMGSGRQADVSTRYDKSIFQGKQFGQVLAGQAMQGGKVVSTLSKLALGLTRTNLITGALVVGGGILLKVFKDHAEAQARLADSYGLTANRAKTLGVNYTDYVQVLKSSLNTMQLARDKNRALYESIMSSKTPLNLTIEKYKELRKEVKESMTRELELVNKSNAEDLSDLLVRLKVQLMATGMSAEEATNKLYALVSLSNFKSMAGQVTLLNKEFTNIKTSADVAFKAIKQYQSAAREGLSSKVQFAALTTALNALGNALDVTEDKNKTYFENQKQRYNQESKFIDELKRKGLDKAEVDRNVINQFIAQDATLAGILGKSETVLSIWQKIQIVAKGFTGDLVGLNAEQVSALYDLVNNIYSETVKNQGFGTLKDEYNQLDVLIKRRQALIQATKQQSAEEQISSRKRIEFLQKEIKKINEIAEAKQKALQEEKEDEDYLIQIQKKKIEYQNALAAGDMSKAAQAQLDIQSLTSQQERTLASRAIEEKRQKDIAPLQSEIDRINKANQELADKAAIAADGLGKLDQKIAELRSRIDSVTKAITDYRVAFETGQTGAERRDAAIQFLEAMGIKIPQPGTAKTADEARNRAEGKTTGKDIVDLADQALKKYLENQTVNTAIINAAKVYLDEKNAGAGTSSEDPRTYTDKKITDALLKLGFGDKQIQQFKEGRTLDALTGSALIKELGIKPGEYFQAYGGVYRHEYYGGITKVRNAKSSERKTFSEGGKISGPGTSTSDSIPILASDGEFMWSAKAVQNAGGPNAVGAMHEYFKNAQRRKDGGPIEKKSTPVMSSAKTGPAALADRIATEKWYKENGYFKDSDGVWRKNPPSFLEKYTTKQNWKDYVNGHGAIYDDMLSKFLTLVFGPGASNRYFGGENFATGEWLTALANVTLVGKLGSIAARGFIEQAGIMQGIPNLGKLLPQGSIPYLTGSASQAIKGASNLAMLQAGHSLIANKFSSTIGKDSPLLSMISKQKYKETLKSIYSRQNVTIGEAVYPTYTLGNKKDKIAFAGYKQDFSDLEKTGVRIISTTPEGILEEALRLNPKDKTLKKLLDNFKSKNYGPEENAFLDNMVAAVSIGRRGKPARAERTDGFAVFLASLAGDNNAKQMVAEKTLSYRKHILEQANLRSQKYLAEEKFSQHEGPIRPDLVPVLHSSRFPVVRNKDGSISLFPAGQHTIGTPDPFPRASLHFTLEAPVESHLFGSWDPSWEKIVSPLSSMVRDNNLPYNLHSIDTWWMRSPGQALNISNASIIKPFKNQKEYESELIKRGLLDKGGVPSLFTVDSATKDVLHILKQSYDDADRLAIVEAAEKTRIARYQDPKTSKYVDPYDEKSIIGHEEDIAHMIALQLAKKELGINTSGTTISGHGLSSIAKEQHIRAIAEKLGLRHGQHDQSGPSHMESAYQLAKEKESPYSSWALNKISSGESLEAIRMAALHGRFKTDVEEVKKPWVSGIATGGYITKKGVIRNFAKGGYAGSDLYKMADGGYVNPSIIKLNSIPKFDDGIKVVPEDMLAMIHKNEAVIPAEMNPFNPNNNGTMGTQYIINNKIEVNAAPGMDTDALADQVAIKIARQNQISTAKIGRTVVINS